MYILIKHLTFHYVILFNISFYSTGGPFRFQVLDASKVSASGDGLGLVPAGRAAAFLIDAPGAHVNDFEVKIYGKKLWNYTCLCNDLNLNV